VGPLALTMGLLQALVDDPLNSCRHTRQSFLITAIPARGSWGGNE